MGTLRYWTDDAGEDHELSDHEGYVEAELDITNPLVPERGTWAAYYGPDVDGHFTGRHRAACDCGWRAPVVDLSTLSDDGILPGDVERRLMAAWDEHVDAVIEVLRTLGPVERWSAQARHATAQLERAIGAARRAGHSWEAIGRSVGVTRQAAWERYRHLEPA